MQGLIRSLIDQIEDFEEKQLNLSKKIKEYEDIDNKHFKKHFGSFTKSIAVFSYNETIYSFF